MAKPVFSAGYDMGGFQFEKSSEGTGPERFASAVDAVAELRAVTICALNGSVYGGATDLALACDLCVAWNEAVFKMPAAAIGLHYYPSGMHRYLRKLGLSLSQRAFLTTDTLPIAEWDKVGVIYAMRPAGEVIPQAHALAQRIAQLPAHAVQGMKASLAQPDSADMQFKFLQSLPKLMAPKK
jgi:enoyl-CoA hydratase/carnithine racemase